MATDKNAKQTPHTPEPWEYVENEIVGKDGVVIAAVCQPGDFPCAVDHSVAEEEAFDRECQANGVLLASAPALQARNEELVEGLNWVITRAQSALSGQPSPLREENERLQADWERDIDDDAKRAGIDTRGIVGMAVVHTIVEKVERLQAQRDELLTACKLLLNDHLQHRRTTAAKDKAIAAIISAEKGGEQ